MSRVGESGWGDTPLGAFREPTAQEAKRAGMAQVDENANEVWKRQMFECVVAVAKVKRRFTSDDIFDVADERGCKFGTHDLRAFGPIMTKAAKAQICRKADCAPVNSRRASRHAAPLSVWDSLICEI